MVDKDTLNDKTRDLSKFRFNYGPGMQKQCIESNNSFLDHIGSVFGHSAKVFLEEGEIVITGVDETLLPSFDTEENMKAHATRLNH